MPSTQELIDRLFGTDVAQAVEARAALTSRGATSPAEAEALLAALTREPPPPGALPRQAILLAIQASQGPEVVQVFRRAGAAAIGAAYPGLAVRERPMALKLLGMIGTRESFALLVERLKAPDAPKDFSASISLSGIYAKTPHAEVLFPALSELLDAPDFRAIAALDLANALVAEGALKLHPAAPHLARLAALVRDPDDRRYSYAVSACTALRRIEGKEALGILRVAELHPDPAVRLEASYALASQAQPGGVAGLVRAAVDPVTALRAIRCLTEIDRQDLIPVEAREPEFVAKAEMIQWLSHPMEYGRPPEAIELWERRTLLWPPTGDTRELFLFRYRYPAREPGQPADEGVGLVGSVTFSLFGETRASGTPDDAFAAHCVWELDQKGDPRGKGRSLEVGRQLLGIDARA